jgi:hypothetical protein
MFSGRGLWDVKATRVRMRTPCFRDSVGRSLVFFLLLVSFFFIRGIQAKYVFFTLVFTLLKYKYEEGRCSYMLSPVTRD